LQSRKKTVLPSCLPDHVAFVTIPRPIMGASKDVHSNHALSPAPHNASSPSPLTDKRLPKARITTTRILLPSPRPCAAFTPVTSSSEHQATFPPLQPLVQLSQAGTLVLNLEVRLDKLVSILQPLYPTVPLSDSTSPARLYYLTVVAFSQIAQHEYLPCPAAGVTTGFRDCVYLYDRPAPFGLGVEIAGCPTGIDLDKQLHLTAEERRRSYVRIPVLETVKGVTILPVRAEQQWLEHEIRSFDSWWDRDEWTPSLSWRLIKHSLLRINKFIRIACALLITNWQYGPLTTGVIDGSPTTGPSTRRTASQRAWSVAAGEGDHGGGVRGHAREAARAREGVEVSEEGGLRRHDHRCYLAHGGARSALTSESTSISKHQRDRGAADQPTTDKGKDATLISARMLQAAAHSPAVLARRLLSALPAELAYTFCGIAPPHHCGQSSDHAPPSVRRTSVDGYDACSPDAFTF